MLLSGIQIESMAYTPNNVFVYTAAFAGCSGGIMAYRKTKQTAPISFQELMQVADAFAQAIDTVWSGTPTQLDVDIITFQVQAQFAGGFPTKRSKADYQELAATIVGLVTAAQNQYAVEGITPPPLPAIGATGWLGSLTLDFAGASTINLTTVQAKNAALHFIDSTGDHGPYTVNFPDPATDTVAYPNLVFNDTLNVVDMGYAAGVRSLVPTGFGYIISSEVVGQSGFWSNVLAPLQRSKTLSFIPTNPLTLDASSVFCGALHFTDSTGDLPGTAVFPEPPNTNQSYVLSVFNDGLGAMTIKYLSGVQVRLAANTTALIAFEPGDIRSAVNGNIG